MSTTPCYASAEAFATALCAFVNHDLPRLHSRLARSPDVTPDTPLFATGILDSLAVLHLVALVEDSIGRPLTIDEVVMHHFRDARTIASTFWSPTTHPKSPANSTAS